MFTDKMWKFILVYLLLPRLAHLKCESSKKLIPAPVFDEGENLSYEDCGVWTAGGNIAKPPWRAAIHGATTGFCIGHLISPTSVLTWGCAVHDAELQQVVRETRAYVGRCADDKLSEYLDGYYKWPISGDCTSEGKGQIVKATEVNYKSIPGVYTYAVWKIKTVQMLTDHIWPICLFNLNNQRDFAPEGKYYAHSRYWPEKLFHSVNLTKDTDPCFGHAVEDTCTRLKNAICAHFPTDKDDTYVTLLYTDSKRYYMRGTPAFHAGTYTDRTFIDLLEYMHVIAEMTNDIFIMPKIPQAKSRTDFSSIHHDLNSVECGLTASSRNRREATPFIGRGSEAKKYDHPWHAAILSDTHGIICGGTLISKRIVVTAAHCVYNRDKIKARAEDLEVVIGILNKDDVFDVSSVQAQAKRPELLIEHPSYNPLLYKNDVALMIFKSPGFSITDTVRPVCLWEGAYDFGLIERMRGDVVGWGLTESRERSDSLKKANLRIENYRDCYLKFRSFYSQYLKPGENFCAGSNGVGACQGDSGGGFVVKKDGVHFLRGLVSFGNTERVVIDDQVFNTCNLNVPSIYVDLANYMEWIKDRATEHD